MSSPDPKLHHASRKYKISDSALLAASVACMSQDQKTNWCLVDTCGPVDYAPPRCKHCRNAGSCLEKMQSISRPHRADVASQRFKLDPILLPLILTCIPSNECVSQFLWIVSFLMARFSIIHLACCVTALEIGHFTSSWAKIFNWSTNCAADRHHRQTTINVLNLTAQSIAVETM